MLAVAGKLPSGEGWAYEFKWDGVRVLADVGGGVAALTSRSGRDVTVAYPELRALGGAVGDALLDGEVVAFDEAMRPSFTLLAKRMGVTEAKTALRLARTTPVAYMIFDLLRLDGRDLRRLPYRERRAALDALGLEGPHWITPPVTYDGPAAMSISAEQRLEGVVAKRLDSPYLPGARSSAWVKVKHLVTGDYLVGGWTSDRRALSSLVLGERTPEGLVYRGRVGTGFDERTQRTLVAELEPLAVERSPFAGEVPRKDAGGVRWVRPELTVEVAYAEVTPQGRVRHARFNRIRTDLM
ncbi:non-homologous end-joining DNA ligase [Phytomonospora sp. NPDC050363]|uniref:non-homologous end-joining DNA ligase n=1 Tax=Phytomonospora sp. NPDC050363 TaxID=3155642 RepID=UPI0033D447F3